MIQVSIMRGVWDPLGLHLSHTDLKLGKKRPSYGQFIKGRLRDPSEYHAKCKRSINASFEPNVSKIGPEMAELRPSYTWEVA